MPPTSSTCHVIIGFAPLYIFMSSHWNAIGSYPFVLEERSTMYPVKLLGCLTKYLLSKNRKKGSKINYTKVMYHVVT